MISVVTLTYQRAHILEEAMESFLRQDFAGDKEMIIINDSSNVHYTYNHPNVKIINIKERFGSIWEKLKYGIHAAKYNFVYRLDDDDLLAPWALRNTWDDITSNPGYEIYRSDAHYFFTNNVLHGISDNINNGNVYTKAYINRVQQFMPNVSLAEDAALTFHFNAKIYTSNRTQKSMVYRWGMGTYHISGMGIPENNIILEKTDALIATIAHERNTNIETGICELRPNFKAEYYTLLPTENT
jgi:glycosyltransferase involved in cell wall biosynthesis